ncbi:hypothetical protein [Sporomusa aerivorans]|uniref:hypothetical protein n=1 Tax=Sporomusa aerivorans TaxID=204936 RepID=UPI00352AAA3D
MEMVKLNLPGREGETYIAFRTEEQKAEIHKRLTIAAWVAWNLLSVEERQKMNLGVDLTKILQKRLFALKAE